MCGVRKLDIVGIIDSVTLKTLHFILKQGFDVKNEEEAEIGLIITSWWPLLENFNFH